MTNELEQAELPARFGLSLSTVKRMVRTHGPEPVRYQGTGNRPVFTAEQADAMKAAWEADKKKQRTRPKRRCRKPAALIVTIREAKRRAAR